MAVVNKGDQFGRLTVIEVYKDKSVLCSCSCEEGKTAIISSYYRLTVKSELLAST